MILAFAECRCHVWVISALDRMGRCRRCGEEPVRLPQEPSGRKMVTMCKHDGPCR